MKVLLIQTDQSFISPEKRDRQIFNNKYAIKFCSRNKIDINVPLLNIEQHVSSKA